MIRNIKYWNRWRKRSGNGILYQLLVLFKVTKSPTFELCKYMWGVNDDGLTISQLIWRADNDSKRSGGA